MPRQPTVILTDNERTILETFVHRGKAHARTLTRAYLLLKSADGWSTSALVTAFAVCETKVTNVRRHFTQGGLEAVLHDKVRQFQTQCSFRLADDSSHCHRLQPITGWT